MDEEGAFSVENIGKFSIFVNGKEVPTHKRVNLLRHSLVKVCRNSRILFLYINLQYRLILELFVQKCKILA